MDIRGKKFLLIDGPGLIGSHTVDLLRKDDLAEIPVYDNFARSRHENLAGALRDPSGRIYDVGGDVCQIDVLSAVMQGVNGVFHVAVLWLLQCHDFLRAAFDLNIRGIFSVLEARVQNKVKRLVYCSSASVYGDAIEEFINQVHPLNNKNSYGATKICGEAMAGAYPHRYGLDLAAVQDCGWAQRQRSRKSCQAVPKRGDSDLSCSAHWNAALGAAGARCAATAFEGVRLR